MIKHFDNTIYWWNQEGEPIKKVMLGGYRVFQLLSDTNPEKVYYRWINLDPTEDFECVGFNKCYIQQKQMSLDQINWENVIPAVYRTGDVYEYDSTDCGYIPPIYRWINLDPSEYYYCSGTTKYYKQQKQVSYDDGDTWESVIPAEYQMGDVAQIESTDCGYIPPQYRDVTGTPYCNGFDKMVDIEHQVSYDGGETWTTTATTSSVVERYSRDCGYIEGKVMARNLFGEVKYIECDGIHSISQSDVDKLYSGFTPTYIEIGNSDCVDNIRSYAFDGRSGAEVHICEHITSISYNAFQNAYTNYTFEEGLQTIGSGAFRRTDSGVYNLTLPSTVTSIGDEAFAGRFTNTITLTSLEPPTISYQTFLSLDGSFYNIVKVPCASLNKYQKKWYSYANNNKRLIEKVYPIESGCWDSTGDKCTFEYQYDLSPVVVRSGTVQNNNVTILYGDEVSAISQPTTHAHFQYNKFNLTNKPLTVYGVSLGQGCYVTFAPDCRVTTIGGSFNECVFEGDEVILPSVEEIGGGSFRNCSGLTNVVLEGITQILGGSFNYCSELESLTLGSGLTTIGLDTIKYCSSLKTITCKATTPPTLGAYALNGAQLDAIYVPSDSVDLYKNTGRWAEFASIIQAIP